MPVRGENSGIANVGKHRFENPLKGCEYTGDKLHLHDIVFVQRALTLCFVIQTHSGGCEKCGREEKKKGPLRAWKWHVWAVGTQLAAGAGQQLIRFGRGGSS